MRLLHIVNLLLNIVAEVVVYKSKIGQQELLVASADKFHTAGIWQHRTVI
jgi:hypothetical protein